MIGHDGHRFMAHSQSFQFHRRSDHQKSLPGSNTVTEQRRLTLQNSSDSIELVGPECDTRIHSRQLQMASVIAPLAKAVVPLVINGAEFTRPSFITPEPFNELRFDLGQF